MAKEKALLVFISFTQKIKSIPSSSGYSLTIDENIEELTNLTVSAGAEVLQVLSYRQTKPNPKYFISTGRLEIIKNILSENEVDLIIFDDEINPTQQRNLQRKLDIGVVDRTALILDILEPIGGENCSNFQTESLYSGLDLPDLSYISNKKFLATETAAPPMPKPLNNESAIPLTVLYTLLFSSSSSPLIL